MPKAAAAHAQRANVLGEEARDAPACVAVVGTLAEFRRDPVPHDLADLVRFVAAINPDLLCLDVSLDQWLRRDFGGLPLEYRDALLPLAAQTDIVVIPIGDEPETTDRAEGNEIKPGRLKGWLRRQLRGAIARLARRARTPVSVGEGLRHLFVEHLLHLLDLIEGGRHARRHARAHREALTGRILELAQRDPARRVLVVVNARHCHKLRRTLRRRPQVALVHYSNL